MKKLCAALLSIGLILSAAPLGLFASDQNGTATAVFLRMPQGARAQGMGGAFSAVSGDVESTWWNPAGPVMLGAPQFTASYNSFIEDISATYAALAVPFGARRRSSILVNATYVSLGTVDARDNLGNSAGSISPNGLVIGAGLAICAAPGASIGIMAKNVQQNLGDDKGSGVAFDAGVLIKLSPNLNFGLCGQNMGSKFKTDIKDLALSVQNDLPMDVRAGFAYSLSRKFLVAVDGEKPVDADTSMHFGTEYSVSDSFTIRAGYNTSSAAGFTMGVGILTPVSFTSENDNEGWWKEASSKDWTHNVVRIDYAYVTTNGFDATHRISLTLKL